jgi:nitrate reductase NapE
MRDAPADTAHDKADARPSPRHEFIVFATIAALIWPVVAVSVVGGFGFIVWMSQLVFGPPGPPH